MWYIFTAADVNIDKDVLDIDANSEILSGLTYINKDKLKNNAYKDLESIDNTVKINAYHYDSTNFRKANGALYCDIFCRYRMIDDKLHIVYISDGSTLRIPIENPVKTINEYIIFKEIEKKKVRKNNRYYTKIIELISEYESSLENSYNDNAYYLLDAEKRIFLKYCKEI